MMLREMNNKREVGKWVVLNMIMEVGYNVWEVLEMMMGRVTKEWGGMDVPANKMILVMGTREVVDMFMEGWDKVRDMLKYGELWDRGYLEPGYPL